jgi:hypothetical protein
LRGDRGQSFIAQGVDARSRHQGVRRQGVQTFHPVRHTPSGNARDLWRGAQLIPARDVIAVGSPVGLGQSGVLLEAPVQLSHRAGGLQAADRFDGRRVGQIEDSRERLAGRQARIRHDHNRGAADATDGDFARAARLPAQLRAQGLAV